MTDYTKATGASGVMMIRDVGGKIQFWLKAGTDTASIDVQYGYTINGGTDNTQHFHFVSSNAWQMVRQWTVTESQLVIFRLFDTGTVGLGGPTTLSVSIDRDTVPDAPSIPTVSLTTSTTAQVKFTDPAFNGGSAIDGRQLAYRETTDTDADFLVVSASLSTGLTGLTPGVSYYVQARVHNSFGYSEYGPRTTFMTLTDPEIPGLVKFSNITQTSVTTEFTDGDTGGTGIVERQVGYSLVQSLPTTILTYSGPTTVTGLHPSTWYYFRSRTRNSVGWSDWSPATSVKTLAGVRINVGGVWRSAVPYVKVAGVWKLARPWGRQAGNWEEAS